MRAQFEFISAFFLIPHFILFLTLLKRRSECKIIPKYFGAFLLLMKPARGSITILMMNGFVVVMILTGSSHILRSRILYDGNLTPMN
jgi:hypothetical protein